MCYSDVNFSRLRQFLVLFTHADCDRRLLRRMVLRNKFLSPTCQPDLGNADTYFKQKNRSEIRMCVTVASFPPIYDITITHILISDRNIFSKKKYVLTSPRPGGHGSERNLFIRAIRRSNRRSQSAYVKITKN